MAIDEEEEEEADKGIEIKVKADTMEKKESKIVDIEETIPDATLWLSKIQNTLLAKFLWQTETLD